MATKSIIFGNSLSTVAVDSDTMRLGVIDGVYPKTAAGITAGLVTNPGSSASSTGEAAPFDERFPIGPGATRRIRVDRTAGTFVVRVQQYVLNDAYYSPAFTIYDSNGTTVLASLSVANAQNTSGGFRLLNTAGALITTGTADAGVSITTTGGNFFVEWTPTGFFAWAGRIQFDTATDPPAYTSLVVTSNPNTAAITSFPAPLLPITVQKRDQFNAPTSLGPTTVSVSEIGLDYDVTGTLTQTFSGSDATFNDLIATNASVVVPEPPTISGFVPSSGAVGTVVTISGENHDTGTAATLGGTGLTVLSRSATTTVVQIPAGASSGVFTITNPDGTAVSVGTFTVTVPPPIDPSTPVESGIYNYRTLKDYVALFLGRADLESKMDGVCDMAESRIRRLLRDRTVGPVAFALAEGVTLPDDCGELRTVRYVGPHAFPYVISVTSVPAVTVRRGLRADVPGLPETIAIVQRKVLTAPLVVEPVPVEITYYQTVPPLVADTDTNWLLDTAPDVYVYGMLLHFSQYLVEDERVPMWEASFATAMKELERARERREYGSLPLETLNEYTF